MTLVTHPPMAVVFPLEKSGQVALVAAPAALSVLSIVAVALRVVARRMANRGLDWSDYTIIVACVSETPSVAGSSRPERRKGMEGERHVLTRDLGAVGDVLGHHHVRFVSPSGPFGPQFKGGGGVVLHEKPDN